MPFCCSTARTACASSRAANCSRICRRPKQADHRHRRFPPAVLTCGHARAKTGRSDLLSDQPMTTSRRIPLALATAFVILPVRAALLPAQETLPWRFSGLPTGEYQVALDNTVVRGGRPSARVDGWVATPMGGAGLVQQVRAENYKGRRVRFSAHLRTRDVRGAGAWISLSVVSNSGVPAQSSTQQAALTGSADWKV